MKYKYHGTEGKYPYLIIDNWYTPEEEKKIWKELDFITQTDVMLKPTDPRAHAAHDSEEKPLAKHFKIFLGELYTTEGRKYSHILQLLSKQKTKKFVTEIVKNALPDHSSYFEKCNSANCLISYYEDGDYYKSHFDVVNYTTFVWLYKEPKNFTGGNLVLTGPNETVECINNRLLLIPSFYYHAVTEVNQNSSSKVGYGRYCISTFWYPSRT